MQRLQAFRALLGHPQVIILSVVCLLLMSALIWPLPKTPAQSPAQAQDLAVVQPPITPRPNCETAKCLALTFDDGPDPAITPQILDILKRHNAHATFFVMGKHVPGNEAIVQRTYAEGHHH